MDSYFFYFTAFTIVGPSCHGKLCSHIHGGNRLELRLVKIFLPFYGFYDKVTTKVNLNVRENCAQYLMEVQDLSGYCTVNLTE